MGGIEDRAVLLPQPRQRGDGEEAPVAANAVPPSDRPVVRSIGGVTRRRGVLVGTPGQSCGAGLSCPIVLADGSKQDADCCESIALAGGAFPMGCSQKGTDQCPLADVASGACFVNEVPEVSITLAPFELDRFEVTVARFRAFFDAFDGEGLPGGAAPSLAVAESGWQPEWNAVLPTSKEQLEADVSCSTNPHGATPLEATWTHAPGANESLPINCITWYEAFAFCVWDGGFLPTEAGFDRRMVLAQPVIGTLTE